MTTALCIQFDVRIGVEQASFFHAVIAHAERDVARRTCPTVKGDPVARLLFDKDLFEETRVHGGGAAGKNDGMAVTSRQFGDPA